MVKFSVPEKSFQQEQHFFSFSVRDNTVLFAGLRNAYILGQLARGLVNAFARLGFGFFVGCARGIDQCFRNALAKSQYAERTFVVCAFLKRVQRNKETGLFAFCVVPDGVPPKAALVRRTLWMVKRSSFIVLFPDNPKTGNWGKGSSIVFNATVLQLKPLFVISKSRPKPKDLYKVLPACFQGLVEGCWVIPHPMEKGGTCDDES